MYGLWDQIRVDHGREWYLMLFIQQQLAQLRNNVTKPPYIQTSSKKVHYTAKSVFDNDYAHDYCRIILWSECGAKLTVG